MPAPQPRVFVAALAAVALLTLISSSASAQSCETPAARAVSVQGDVQVVPAGGGATRAAALGDAYCPGDTIRAGEHSRADLALLDQSVLRVRANTELVLEGPVEESSYLIDVLNGAAHFLSRSGERRLDVKTPFTVAGVRGTEFAVNVTAGAAEVLVLEGEVLAANSAGSVSVGPGQTAVATGGAAPVLRLEARPRDAVRWTLYYPPVRVATVDDFPGDDAWQATVRNSIDARDRGDLAAALAALDGVPAPGADDPSFLLHRASLYLAVGSVDEAAEDLARAQRSAPRAEALALEAVIAVAQNENDRARERAEQAVALEPGSAAAHIALSYSRQAHFDLPGALEAAREATRVDPEEALAWARVAELESATGDRAAADTAAARAAELAPGLGRTQIVRGFAALASVDIDAARQAFERAIPLDQADPMARLGLGLAKIRSGDLDGGARELEIAASLDPNNALVRSYLGKAYFEEKREGLDEREYDLAKTLDPSDPTPWFYDAIAKQTTNRPVEALESLEAAIERNDNRAVYRSRLLLDSDLAARSSALGRVYSDLGFQSLALVEGWKSVNTDPVNYSAHRLLADSYAALPRHEIARVSELLQSQLLQPINSTPIQPFLAESNLAQISSQGPAVASFNEFNPLFTRNQMNGQLSGVVGEDDTYLGEGIFAGIANRLSFSAGYSHYWTDGFRINNGQEDELGTAFAQLELGPQTSVQAEFRYRDTDFDDTEINFFPDEFSPYRDIDVESKTVRAGLRHALSPNSTILASYIFRDREEEDFDRTPPIVNSIAIDKDDVAHSGEAQYLFRSGELGWGPVEQLNLTLGVGHFSIDTEQLNVVDVAFSPTLIVDETRPDIEHTNAYLYSSLSFSGGVVLTAGVSGDVFDQDEALGDETQVNPKVGITWNPSFLPGTTFRAAGFRTFKRTLVTDQTLEPTQVAGFNQFYDDANTTDAWRYGVAVDQKFSTTLFGGIELSKRELDVPLTEQTVSGQVVRTVDWEESFARGYGLWTPAPWVALRLEYQFERFERDRESFARFVKVKTHRVPFGAQFFHRSGLSLSLTGTYQTQDGDFWRAFAAQPEDGDRDMWFFDLALRYRLPKRYGFVTVGVNNLLDEDQTYQATDFRNPGPLRPDRFAFARVTLALP